MRTPYLAGALKGWTKPTAVKLITKSVAGFLVVETPAQVTLDINYQPMPASQVNRKPEEQRTWIWWTLIVKGASAPMLKTDDQVVIGSLTFRIQQGVQNWGASGFSLYEAIQDFTSDDPEAST